MRWMLLVAMVAGCDATPMGDTGDTGDGADRAFIDGWWQPVEADVYSTEWFGKSQVWCEPYDELLAPDSSWQARCRTCVRFSDRIDLAEQGAEHAVFPLDVWWWEVEAIDNPQPITAGRSGWSGGEINDLYWWIHDAGFSGDANNRYDSSWTSEFDIAEREDGWRVTAWDGAWSFDLKPCDNPPPTDEP